jgi:hypothetical protein
MYMENVQAEAQSWASAFPALDTLFMINMVWFIIDATAELDLRVRKDPDQYFRNGGGQGMGKQRKDTYEFMLTNWFIASVRFPVT